jgi:hypothetical protein
MREKLAWAEANGVEPPAFVREAAAREALADASSWSHDNGACCAEKHCCCCCKCGAAHCDEKVSENCASEIGPSKIHSLVAAADSAPAKPSNQPVRQSSGRSLILLMALACQSQSLLSILAQALPAILPVIRNFERSPVARLAIAGQSCCSIRIPPPVPPPERFLPCPHI